MKNKLKLIIMFAAFFIISLAFFKTNNQKAALAEGTVNCGPKGNGCKVNFISGGDTSIVDVFGYMERQE